MRLMELIQDPLTARIRDAIYVMLARSKTTGEPYEISYEQLSSMLNFPGPIGPSEIESALNIDPSLASIVDDFDTSKITVDAAAEEPADALSNIGMMPGLTSMPPLGMPPGPPAAGAPPVPLVAQTAPQAEPQMGVNPVSTVDNMAKRALRRRGV